MGKRKYMEADLQRIAAAVKTKALALFDKASPETVAAGEAWYPLAHAEARILAHEFNVPVETAAAVIAVLSPLTRWIGNVEDAWAIFMGEKPRHSLPRNAEKARRIIAGESPAFVMGNRSHKVPNFCGNILYPFSREYVTADSWIGRAVDVTENDLFNVIGVYAAVKAGITAAADERGVLPNVMQAVVWLVFKLENDRAQAGKAAASLPVPF